MLNMNLTVLRYDKLEPVLYTDFTYRLDYFKNHLALLNEEGYTSINCQQIIDFFENKTPLPDKPVLLTFEGAYLANFEWARLVLKEFGFSATFFIPGEKVLLSTCKEPPYSTEYMHIEHLQLLQREGFELALNSYRLSSFFEESFDVIRSDIQKNISFFKKFELTYIPAFSYPGDFKNYNFVRKRNISEILRQLKFKLIFQPGKATNKTNTLDPFAINSLSLTGVESKNDIKKRIDKGSWLFF